jgi:hypothetical protein
MEIVSVRKGYGRTVVTIANVGEVNDAAVRKVAYRAANENASSLFGSNITYHDEDDLGLTAVVSLYTA